MLYDIFTEFLCFFDHKYGIQFQAKRFYLTGVLTNFYSFIQVSLEWSSIELLFSNTLLWIQQKFITFKVFLCRILIIGWNNKWIHHTSDNMLSVTLIYRQEVASLFQVQGKFKACKNSKWTFSNSCFIARDSHIKIIWLHTAVFTKHDNFASCK